MTVRYNENDINVSNGIVKLDDNGKMPILDGTQLSNLNLTGGTANITNNYDAYEFVVISSNTTIENGKLYLVTASCTCDFINIANDSEGRVGFIIANDTTTLTLRANVGSGGSALRFCVNGICYGNAPADTTFGPTSSSTPSYTGAGKSLEFIAHNDGIRTAWIEKSHITQFEANNGTTVQGNWGNFDNVYGTNAATLPTKYVLVFNGVDWVYRPYGQDITNVSVSNGVTTQVPLPLDHVYMDHIHYVLDLATATYTSGPTIDLYNLSGLERHQIHGKPLLFSVLNENYDYTTAPENQVFPHYFVKFTDTRLGVTFQQQYNTSSSFSNPPSANMLGMPDITVAYSATPATVGAHYHKTSGVVGFFNWDTQKWYWKTLGGRAVVAF